ncbi:YtpR family tRNA-binding protein [Bacillus pumilus]|uniref:YtpR family tRNA-binding protein n=1 Tax=Bacillus altitudinis TaxID=293387 RepID=UPI00080ABB16|nr:tRNA-binding protein [Bacillus pumilus]
MNVFYNAEGVGDTLLISLKNVTREEVGHETFGDVVRIFNQDTKETTGFNIFNASTYMKIEENGSVPLSETLVQDINEILNRNGVSETLTVDLSPKFVVGYVKEKEKHPNADKLNICQVDVGDETLQIVCGAPNVDQGQYVVVAKVGAVMPSGLVIKDAELRGVPSSGMICSAKELDLPNAPAEKGILVLEGSRQAGEPFEA